MSGVGTIFPIGLNEFATVNSIVNKMITEDKIDKVVINHLTKLFSIAKEKETFWKDCSKISTRSAFMIYHTWRNIRLIISKMIVRFHEAEQRHENPKTANDCLRLLPSLIHTYTFLHELGEKEFSDDERKRIFDQVTILRNSAFHAEMLPSLKEEMKELNKNAMITEFESFAQGIESKETSSKSDN